MFYHSKCAAATTRKLEIALEHKRGFNGIVYLTKELSKGFKLCLFVSWYLLLVKETPEKNWNIFYFIGMVFNLRYFKLNTIIYMQNVGRK